MAYKFNFGPARLSGSTTFEDALSIESTVSGSGAASFGGVLKVGNDTTGVIGIGADADLLTLTDQLLTVAGGVTATGRVLVDDATEATSTTDGSLQTDGGLSVAKSAVIGDDLDLLSNAAIFKVGSDQPFTLTHANANNTLLASQNHRLAFGAAGEYISGDGTDLKIVSSGDVDITGTTDVVGGLSSTQATVLAQTAGTTTIGSSNAAVFSADGKLNINSTTDASDATDGSLQTDGGLSVAKKIFAGDNISLGKNSGVLTLGQDQQFQITHANANSTAIVGQDDRLAFGQAAKYIVGDGTDMEIVSDGLIKLSADVSGSGTLDIKGQATLGNSRFVVNENLALLAAPLAVSGTFAIEEAMSSAKLQTDGMLYFDSGSGEVRRSSLVDVAASMAGTGVTATNGVFSVDTTGGDSMSSTLIPADAYGNAALTVGLNYMVSDATGSCTLVLPSGSAGDVVIVKAPGGVNATNFVRITSSSPVTIDGEQQADIELPNGAVSLIYSDTGATNWVIY